MVDSAAETSSGSRPPRAVTSDENYDHTAEKKLTKDERDVTELAGQLAGWLGEALGADGQVRITDVRAPSGSGLSSVTVLLDCEWERDGQAHQDRLAVRIPPAEAAYPVFRSYDLRMQYDVMAAVGAQTDVPVPPLVGVEESSDLIGSPFLVMRAVEGRAPVDNPPYVFGGWLLEADPADREALDRASVEVLAGVHGLPDPHAVSASLTAAAGDDPLRAHFDDLRDYYEWTHREDGMRIPVLERTFDFLEQRWPRHSDPVLSWGDSRPGNILFDGFTPVAVLDWEMAGIAPREVDLGWYVFIHRFFQDIAEVFEMPGLPDFARPDKVAAVYEEVTGYAPQDLDWFITYAALRHGVVMARIKRRMIHFGEEAAPEEPDDYVMHRAALERLIGETP